MFAKGTKVRVKSRPERYIGKNDILGFPTNRHGQVGEVSDVFTGCITDVEQPHVRFSDGAIEAGFFEELEVPAAAFALGDRVKVVDTGRRDHDEDWASRPDPENMGRTGTVVTVGEKGVEVQFDNGDKDYARFHYWAKATPAAAFSPGDVVTLKSGGPKMTVTDVNSGTVETVWHLDTGATTNEVFPAEALCPVRR